MVCREGIVPKRWLEERLLKIPRNIKSLGMKLVAPEREASLLENELCALVKILLEEKPEKKLSLEGKGLPLAAIKEKTVRSQFVIPSRQTTAGQLRPDQSRNGIKLTSLQLGGEGVTIRVMKEIVYWGMKLSHACELKDLILVAVDDSSASEGQWRLYPG